MRSACSQPRLRLDAGAFVLRHACAFQRPGRLPVPTDPDPKMRKSLLHRNGRVKVIQKISPVFNSASIERFFYLWLEQSDMR